MISKIKKEDISKFDILSILFQTSLKILRGFFIKPFLKESHGLLFVGSRAKILNRNKIVTGRNVKFEVNCEVQGLSKRGIKLGNNVTIGNSAMIRPSSYYGVEVGEGLSIGDNSSIGPLTYVGCGGYIDIGSNVMIGPRVGLFAENHSFKSSEKTIKEQGIVRKGIVIEDNCWIGSGVIILDGVTIGSGCVVGAGSIVTKDVQANSILIDQKEPIMKSRVGE